ncbi:hypothetical protein BBJ28_00013133 [Nothophytophthora sp. Chile5]|nr:hypothetical protein BBJ28_00013133 [Nothophytophthora sp. Chile5]
MAEQEAASGGGGGGLSNADFARLFRTEARQEAGVQEVEMEEKAGGNDVDARGFNPMQQAAMRRRQEMAGEPHPPTEEEARDTEAALPPPARGGLGGIGFMSSIASSGGTLPARGGISVVSNGRKAKTKTFSWEKHTTGFGTKMLAKMGFKGRLGKKEDGVSSTIEVKKRPTQMGIGYGDFTEASNLKQNRKLQKELKGETFDEDADRKQREREAEVLQEDDTLWRRRKAPIGGKKHKRAADLTLEAQSKKKKRADVVLDMRGPDVRVLSDITAAYDVDPQRMEAAKPKLGDELIYNVRMVVNLAQGKIYDLTQKIDANAENAAVMKKEAKLIKAQLDMDDVRLQHVQGIVQQLKKLDELRDRALEARSVEPLLTHLRVIRRNFPLEFDAHKLQQLVPSLCMPPLRALLSVSDLLDSEASGDVIEQFRQIQMFLLELPSVKTTAGSNSPTNVLPVIREKTVAMGDELYNFILEETLWPAMVQCVNVQWEVCGAASDCIATFVRFRPHLSSEFEQAFLCQLVLPRLKNACHRWNPQTDSTPIDEWLLPWLPYVGSAMESLYPDIQLALASALNQWHPSDLSILAVISTWRKLWGEREYAKFTHRHIVRKLIRCLNRDFEINPQNQSLEALTWVLPWKDYLPERQFIALFEGEFFPKWLKVLRKWVSGTPDLAELEKWYRGWKLFFEKNKMAKHDRLIPHFHGALTLLQVASESVDVPAEKRPPVPELSKSAAKNYQDALAKAGADAEDGDKSSNGETRRRASKEPPLREGKTSPRSVSRNVSLKDVLENLAISHSLTFMPKGFHDGQQVYAFGKHQVIIEQGVVFMEETKGSFKPVDLEQLL